MSGARASLTIKTAQSRPPHKFSCPGCNHHTVNVKIRGGANEEKHTLHLDTRLPSTSRLARWIIVLRLHFRESPVSGVMENLTRSMQRCCGKIQKEGKIAKDDGLSSFRSHKLQTTAISVQAINKAIQLQHPLSLSTPTMKFVSAVFFFMASSAAVAHENTDVVSSSLEASSLQVLPSSLVGLRGSQPKQKHGSPSWVLEKEALGEENRDLQDSTTRVFPNPANLYGGSGGNFVDLMTISCLLVGLSRLKPGRKTDLAPLSSREFESPTKTDALFWRGVKVAPKPLWNLNSTNTSLGSKALRDRWSTA